jgi:stress response protein YsnF
VSPDPINGGRGESLARPSEGRLAGERVEEIVPLVEETVQIGKRAVETGRVRVSITTEAAEETVRTTLRTRRAEVERVTMDREVAEAPPTREEDGVLVISVVEEILVIEKRLVLREEIRLRFVDSEEAVEQTVERRLQRATVERLPPGTATSPGTVEWIGEPMSNTKETAR